jgi:hypothetical protein
LATKFHNVLSSKFTEPFGAPMAKHKKKKRKNKRPVGRVTTVVPELDIHRETRYISERAAAHECRIVRRGGLVLFSTVSGDAWLLDLEDQLALCLCRDGAPQPNRILEGPDTFAIDWQAKFAIDGPAFVFQEKSGRVVVKLGYPAEQVAAMCGRV